MLGLQSQELLLGVQAGLLQLACPTLQEISIIASTIKIEKQQVVGSPSLSIVTEVVGSPSLS
jgi:hypothetical protein